VNYKPGNARFANVDAIQQCKRLIRAPAGIATAQLPPTHVLQSCERVQRVRGRKRTVSRETIDKVHPVQLAPGRLRSVVDGDTIVGVKSFRGRVGCQAARPALSQAHRADRPSPAPVLSLEGFAASKTSRLGQPNSTNLAMSAARQRTDRDNRTGAGSRPQLVNFHTWRQLTRSAAATSFAVNNSLIVTPFQGRAAPLRPLKIGREHSTI